MEVKMIDSEAVTMIVVFPIMIVFWGFVVWAILQWRKMKHKSQLNHKIIDKFASVQELFDFLKTEGGDRLLQSIGMDGLGPREKILSALTKGIIFGLLGVSLIIISQLYSGEIRYLIILGIIVVTLGIGFLITTYVSYRLFKKWGLMDEAGKSF